MASEIKSTLAWGWLYASNCTSHHLYGSALCDFFFKHIITNNTKLTRSAGRKTQIFKFHFPPYPIYMNLWLFKLYIWVYDMTTKLYTKNKCFDNTQEYFHKQNYVFKEVYIVHLVLEYICPIFHKRFLLFCSRT